MPALGKPQAVISEELANEQYNQGISRVKPISSTNENKMSKNLTPNFNLHQSLYINTRVINI